jgi:hypothetical protein
MHDLGLAGMRRESLAGTPNPFLEPLISTTAGGEPRAQTPGEPKYHPREPVPA